MFRNFSGRGGGLPNSKVFEELFCLILDIYQEGGGGTWFQNLWGPFFVAVGPFSGRGGGYLIPKLLRNFSACVWTFFRRNGGVYLIPKMMRSIFVFTWTFFKLNLGG